MTTTFRFFTLLIALLIIAPAAHAQRKKKEPVTIPEFPMNGTEKVVYTGVVNQAESPEELFKRCNRWFNAFYKSPQSVIKNKEEGKEISGSGRFALRYTNPKTGQTSNANQMLYKIEVVFKEGKYRYTITDIKQKSNPIVPVEKWINGNKDEYDDRSANYLVQVDAYFQDLVASLKKEMNSTGAEKSDDW